MKGVGLLLPLCTSLVACATLAVDDAAISTTPSVPASRRERSADTAAPRTALAQRAGHEIAVDGSLEEPAWAAASRQRDFWQREPHEGQPPRYPTEFRVLYDDAAIYVGVRAFDREPGSIRGLLTRRDQWSSSDWITIEIDSYHDRRTAFSFSLNAASVQRDVLLFNDVEMDESWDAVWSGGTRVDADGWTAEFRIPYSQLRFARADVHTWGLQVIRTNQRDKEVSLWAPRPKEKNQNVSLYGDLDGISRIEPSRRVELLPYGVLGGRLYDAAGDPLNDGRDGIVDGGLDAKVGLGSSFTLSATINPDFGQVEADPSEVNLTAKETFFPERRPFFVEGTDIFRFSLGQGDGDGSVESLFYTRRIGAVPHGAADGDYVRQPDATTIYGAAKLSGKTAGGWSIGVLDAVTEQEDALAIDSSGDRQRQVIEPLTNYGLARIKRHLNGGRTEIGGVVTTVHRALDGLDQEQELHRAAYTGGLQLTHRFLDDDWNLNTRLVGSHVRGSAAAIDVTQRSSQRYFQRPDAEHVHYDPTRTSLSGGGLLWDVGKWAGGNYRFALGGDAKSPGLEVNDLGFQRNADYYVQWVWGQFRDDVPGDLLRDYMVNVNGWSVWTWGAEHLNVGGNVNLGGTLRSYWGGYFGASIDVNRQDPGALRGGPSLRSDPSASGWLSLFSDERRRMSGILEANVWSQPASDSWSMSINPVLNVQAASNIEIGAGPAVSRRVDERQFVEEAQDASGEPVYVLGRIDQITTSLTLRVSYTFTPRLSLQVYAQPFVSSGGYASYSEVVAPQAREPGDRFAEIGDMQSTDVDGIRSVDRDGDGVTDYSFSLADFDFRELRSNLVLRWEYAPGSTLFFIWSHSRTSEDTTGSFTLTDELGELADVRGDNVLLLKLNYWLGL